VRQRLMERRVVVQEIEREGEEGLEGQKERWKQRGRARLGGAKFEPRNEK
jgi:hypothetical protein